MARPMNVEKRVIAIEQMRRRAQRNAVKARRWAQELTSMPRGARAQRAADRALKLADALSQAAKAA